MRQGKRTPARGGTKARATRRQPRASFYLSPARQEEIAAITLLGIALLTALGAFNLSGGAILESWAKTLGILFGWGRVLAPLFFGGLGVWLLLDSLDLRPDIGWERPFGFVLVFIFLLTAFHIPYAGDRALDAAQRGEGGGLIGFGISDFLVGAIGVPGAFMILFILLCIALILLFNIPLARILAMSVAGWRALENIFVNSAGAWSSRNRGSSGGQGRTPIEMVTAPPRTNDRAVQVPPYSARDATPRGSQSSEPTASSTLTPQRPSIAARIVGGQLQAPAARVPREWKLPGVPEILEESVEQEISAHEIRTKVRQIEDTLTHFGVPAKVIEVNQGPTITQFGVEPGFLEQKGPDGAARRTKVKVSRISSLQHDLELALAAAPIRVEAPVPGKAIVGIEVPNSQISLVSLRGVMESEQFKKLSGKSQLAFALGQDVSGQPVIADLASMPHLLIAGATGSGKSVCVNALIACLLLTNTPDDLNFVMVDPKRVELSAFNGIPHLYMNQPVVVDMEQAVAALQFAVKEMDTRFREFAKVGARNIESYHQLTKDKPNATKLPYLVLVVDELADLMMVAANDVEKAITRLAQMARATGIHLVLATQRPSVDVVTGLIKANFPSRISFAVTSQVDSRVVLDSPGAEKLLGRGDMLYMASDSSKLFRLQGCFVSDRELDKLVTYWKQCVEMPSTQTGGDIAGALSGRDDLQRARVSPSSIVNATPNQTPSEYVQNGLWSDLTAKPKAEEDELLEQAIQIVKLSDRASVSLLQRKLRIGYSRAAKLIDLLEEKGYVGPDEGAAKGRPILTKGNLTPTGSGKREFESEESFDDWTEADWSDLDKS